MGEEGGGEKGAAVARLIVGMVGSVVGALGDEVPAAAAEEPSTTRSSLPATIELD